jgi:ribosomal protein S18 acetylase RimI-like enzyme
MTTTTPGHGGGAAGTDMKNGTAISGISAHDIPELRIGIVRPVSLTPRVAGPGDLEGVVETIALAFHNDPVWSWAFPDEKARPAQFRRWWPLFVEGALAQGFTWLTDGAETISVWIRPNQPELTDEAEARVLPTLEELLGARSRIVLEGLLRFEAAHPHDEPHYYLSFVATHDDHRGQGIGEQLLAQNLELIDAEHFPAYLESSNPKNLERYRRLGFEPRGEFSMPDNGPPVTTMWRPAR